MKTWIICWKIRHASLGNFRFRFSLLSRILRRSRIHGCHSLFRSCYFSADRKSAKGLRVAGHFTRPEIKRGQLHEERLKLLKLIRVIADEVQLCVRWYQINVFLSRFLIEWHFRNSIRSCEKCMKLCSSFFVLMKEFICRSHKLLAVRLI